MKISAIVWNEWSLGHVARHGVTTDEVEEVCFSGPWIRRGRGRRKRKSYIGFGQSADGRYLMVVFVYLGAGCTRVVTTRDMTGRERRIYRRRRKPRA